MFLCQVMWHFRYKDNQRLKPFTLRKALMIKAFYMHLKNNKI